MLEVRAGNYVFAEICNSNLLTRDEVSSVEAEAFELLEADADKRLASAGGHVQDAMVAMEISVKA